jgi:hypothetical protein
VFDLDEQEHVYSIWTPIRLTDKATGRTVHISIFERELYLSGFFTFEDFWNGEHLSEENNDPNNDNREEKCDV